MIRITLISEAKGRRPHSVEAVEKAVGSRAEAIAPVWEGGSLRIHLWVEFC